LIWADAAYGGQLVDWVATNCGWALEIIKHIGKVVGFVLLPRRWV
jgi:putative transposase